MWAAIAEFWWIGPTMIGAGTLGWIGLRGQRSAKARRLAYDASREALRTARQDAAASRIAVRVARAELAQAQAEAAAGRTTHAEVAAARRALDAAQRETRAAAAGVRARRASLSADRVALSAQGSRGSDPAQLPLGRVMAADDAVTARWMQYETDPARQLAFPAMGDARVPSTAAFLAELKTTRALRPAAPDARITPAQFTAYRDGVARLARAFDAAEAEAWRLARREGTAPAGPGPVTTAPAAWVASAQEIAQNLTQTVLARGAEALARATAPRSAAQPQADATGRPPSPTTDTPTTSAPTRPATPTAHPTQPASTAHPGQAPAAAAPDSRQATPSGDGEASEAPAKPRVWPIPARGTRPSRP